MTIATKKPFALFQTLDNLLKKNTKKPENALIKIEYNNHSFDIKLKRSPQSRRMTLRMSRATGDIVLTIPKALSLREAKAFANKNSLWIAERKSQMPAKIPLQPGSIIPFRGVPHRIVQTNELKKTVTVKTSEQPIIEISGDPKHFNRRIKDFLIKQARHDLSEAVKKYTEKLGTKATKITLRDTKSRWGSCSVKGHLNFSWRLVLAPDYVLDYLAAHEVAHLKQMNHSAHYWRILNELCPHTDAAEKWLKKHGSNLHIYH